MGEMVGGAMGLGIGAEVDPSVAGGKVAKVGSTLPMTSSQGGSNHVKTPPTMQTVKKAMAWIQLHPGSLLLSERAIIDRQSQRYLTS